MRSQITQSPATRALAVLLAIQDELPDSGALLVERPNVTVVLVDSIDAWEDWTLHLLLRRCPVLDERIGDALLAADLLVAAYPVMVLRGELPESGVAA